MITHYTIQFICYCANCTKAILFFHFLLKCFCKFMVHMWTYNESPSGLAIIVMVRVCVCVHVLFYNNWNDCNQLSASCSKSCLLVMKTIKISYEMFSWVKKKKKEGTFRRISRILKPYLTLSEVKLYINYNKNKSIKGHYLTCSNSSFKKIICKYTKLTKVFCNNNNL